MGSRSLARPEGIEPPTLCLEGRRSIRLSYGRAGCIDSRSFIAGNDTILEALTFYRRDRRSIQLNYFQFSVHAVQMGLVRTESQSPKRSGRSNLGEFSRSFSLQQLFPISS